MTKTDRYRTALACVAGVSHAGGYSHWRCCRIFIGDTCHFFIGPCVVFLLVHMAVLYSTTCNSAVSPCFIFLFGHVAWRLPSTWWIFITPRVMPWLFHVSCTGSSTFCIFIWSRGLPRFYHVPNNQFIIKVIQNRHCCTDWLHNYSTMSTKLFSMTIKYNKLLFTHQQQPTDSFTTSNQHKYTY